MARVTAVGFDDLSTTDASTADASSSTTVASVATDDSSEFDEADASLLDEGNTEFSQGVTSIRLNHMQLSSFSETADHVVVLIIPHDISHL